MPIPDLTDRALDDLVRLDGRVAIVTGGAVGIGAAICRRFGEAGAHVVVADINHDAGRATAQRLVDAGGDAEAIAVDVRDGASVEALADGVVRATVGSTSGSTTPGSTRTRRSCS